MIKKLWEWILDLVRIHEDKALHRNKSFWFAIGFPLFWIALIFWVLTVELQKSGNFDPRITSAALNGFVKFYAFPITLLTLPLTFAIMINRFHSSKQKAKSNHLVEVNNIANNYFSHFDSFKEYTKEVEKMHKDVGLEIYAQRLYQVIFINSNMSNFNPKVTNKHVDSLVGLMLYELYLYKEHIDTNGYDLVEDRIIKRYRINFQLFEGIKFDHAINGDDDFYNYLDKLASIYYDIFMFQGVLCGDKIANYLQERFALEIESSFKFVYVENQANAYLIHQKTS
ncbi:hypothetical protein NQS96_06470 [Pseudoalteromonas shioyasakiensis]|uniref:hypothetical protein n=1 Tax=Pseudoalteromonas shioyasakiensis TaxID=1190813 RepID=UPI0021198C36|nr:hypothetical protein [Pseudoalteromonas shioyasakiensis]MCQ8881449.1 hypothetical protein [Pseudoalteromonas shioyasakiensis]